MVKNLLANIRDTRDAGLIPGSGRSPGEGNGNPLQYSCLENPMDREAWQATVHGVAESQTRLSIHKLTLSLVLSRLTLLCDSSQSLQSYCFPLLYVVSMCGAGIRLLPLTPSTL